MSVAVFDLTPVIWSFDMVIQAALMGQGIAMARTSLAALDLAAGNLVRPFAQSVASSGAYYLVYPEEHLRRPRVKAFVSWLKNEVAETLREIDSDEADAPVED
ncbi:LysR substrate-binding domain-containing protein [Thalassospira indica]|uniref:LysR substrate-binding domain-containing protein n=1 Tax=Thalassospira indica TaxID=1891279 RepID=UPI001FE68DD1|nr:LysR substrate-binding domain-containing protein [Thalassospira indica]